MARNANLEAPPESDRFEEAPHPRDAAALVGHEAAERRLLEAYASERLAHAWIVGGPEGIGKATLAWRFAKFLLAHPDPRAPAVREAVDLSVPASHPAARRVSALSMGDLALLRREWNEKTKRHFTEIRVDDVRRALGLFHLASGEGGWRVCLVDCAEDLNRSSANALLKLVEEPPPKSLFLLIAHRPAQVLATLRSRSRLLRLEALSADEIAEAVRSVGPPWSERPQKEIEEAARRSKGSVREALRLLGGEGIRLAGQAERLFSRLPRFDWRAAEQLAGSVSARDREDAYRALLGLCFDWLDARVRKGGAPAELARYAQAWEKISADMRDVEAYNLDRKAFLLGVFSDLAQAAGGA